MKRVLLATLGLALAVGAESPTDLARRFLVAHRARDKTRQTVLAARPAHEVAYTLVVYALLQQGESGAAQALAEARKATGGPEGAGLLQLVATYAARPPTKDELQACAQAEGLLARKQADAALRRVRELGEPREGTVLGVRVLWVRAWATDDPSVFADCARYARAVGWLAYATAAERRRFVLSPGDSREQLLAVNALVDAHRSMDDRPALLAWLAARGDLMQRLGQSEGARKDYAAAIDLAKQMNRPRAAAKLLTSLALVFQLMEHQPRSALRFYSEALDILRKIRNDEGVRPEFHRALRNAAVVLTALARYTEALATWDELLADEPANDLRALVLSRRAYVLGRLGRVEQSLQAHRTALAVVPVGPRRDLLQARLGKLQLRRGDLDDALAQFESILERKPDDVAALAGRATVQGVRRREADALADLDRAAATLKDPAARGTLLLQRAALERTWGRIGDAGRTALEALGLFVKASEDEDPGKRDYANTAVAYLVVGDLLLLRGEREKAEKALGDGAVLFKRLNDSYRTIPAYARWALVLIGLGRHGEALQRAQILGAVAQGTPSDALKSLARCVDGVYEAEVGRPKEAARFFAEAQELAARSGDVGREATALLMLALLDVDKAPELVDRALALLDARRTMAPERHPFVQGELPSFPASIGVRALVETKGDAARALAWIERARAERLQLALRGRAAILDATLPPVLLHAYIDARGRLMEARVSKQGVAEAESAFDAVVARIHGVAPAASDLAFPRRVELERVQAALREDEVLLVMLDDPYARHAVVAVTRTQAALRTFDPQDPLAAVAEFLEGKRNLLVAPDGILAVESPLRVHYVWSAAEFLRLRAAGEAAPEVGFEGDAIRCDLSEPAASAVSYSDKPVAGTVVLTGARIVRGDQPRAEGVAAALQPFFLRGARRVVLSLANAQPADVWDKIRVNLVEKRMPAAEAIAGHRGIVVYGVP